MGNCTSASEIMEIGTAILNEFFSKGLIGQAITALSAPSKCRQTNNLPDFMGCNFLRGQKEVWEIILVLFIAMLIAITALMYLLYRKTTRAIGSIIDSTTNRSDLNLFNHIGGSLDAKAVTGEETSVNPRIEVGTCLEREASQCRRETGKKRNDLEKLKQVRFSSGL